jgi:hypothetical protein
VILDREASKLIELPVTAVSFPETFSRDGRLGLEPAGYARSLFFSL